jgi:hypothetical protein
LAEVTKLGYQVAQEQEINSWKELAQLIQDCSDGNWIFRGECSSSFTLLPKAGRVGEYLGSARKKPYALVDEVEALELFKRQARPHLNHTPASDIEWLAIAQHHGMSTRLLDWTESLLVAAFFATVEAGTKGDAVIYGIREVKSISKAEEKKPFKLGSERIYLPPHITPRIPAQRSVFTVHPDPTVPFVFNDGFRCLISRNACTQIKKILDACAINEGSLFPDIDGLSRYIGWRYKWAKL